MLEIHSFTIRLKQVNKLSKCRKELPEFENKCFFKSVHLGNFDFIGNFLCFLLKKVFGDFRHF